MQHFININHKEWASEFENKEIQIPYPYLLEIVKLLNKLKCSWRLCLHLHDDENIDFKDITSISSLIKNKIIKKWVTTILFIHAPS